MFGRRFVPCALVGSITCLSLAACAVDPGDGTGTSTSAYSSGDTLPTSEAVARATSAWAVLDQPVAGGCARRSWTWGPGIDHVEIEPYVEGANGQRTVVYYDKARMEFLNGGVTRPAFGNLVRELVLGQQQVGDRVFQPVGSIDVPVAGDAVNNVGPTYAAFNAALDGRGNRVGQAPQTFNWYRPDGSHTSYAAPASTGSRDVTLSRFEPATQHNVARVFDDFMNQSGTTNACPGPTARLYDPAVSVFGLPITEPYWVQATVAGLVRDVLVQLFERRVLTYTPTNDDAFAVEMGNVGLHYYAAMKGGAKGQPNGHPCGADTQCASGFCSKKVNRCAERCVGKEDEDPGHCSCDQLGGLSNAVHSACDQERSCGANDCCSDQDAKIAAGEACIAARSYREDTCFDGGDATHREVIAGVQQVLDNCKTLRGQDQCKKSGQKDDAGKVCP